MKKYIPDFVTSLNLLCGTVGIVFAFDGRVDLAFIFMIAGAVFDFCDGLFARALDAYSEMGKELDSLSDVVSFGVLPASMLVCLMRECVIPGGWYCWIPLVLAVAAALRLAKFNVDKRQGESFLGLPAPAGALCAASFAYYVASTPSGNLALLCAEPWLVPLLVICISAMELSELPMFCFKKFKGIAPALKWKRLSFIIEALLIAGIVLFLGHHWSLAVFAICLLYVFKNVLYSVFKA